MRRREFLTAASGAAGAAAASSSAAAQDHGDDSGGNESGGDDSGDSGGGGGTETVALVDYAFEPGTDSPLYIAHGTEVNFVWETSTHNIVVDSQPEEAEWEGHEDIENEGFEYSHTFEVMGEYEFHCQPHAEQGMEGTIVVNEEGEAPGGDGAQTPVDPEHMGVPIQAHWVGVGAMLGIFGSLTFTFYVLKYGTTPHTGYPEEE